MLKPDSTLLTDNGSIRKEFPFIRPITKSQYLIPVYGLFQYLGDLDGIEGNQNKKVDVPALLSESFAGNIRPLPEPVNKAEAIEMEITIAQNALIMVYHLLLAAGALKYSPEISRLANHLLEQFN